MSTHKIGMVLKCLTSVFAFFREPAVKRTICQRCGYILLAGTSADMRMDATNPVLCEIECTQCGFMRRFTLNPKYSSWLDDERAVKERLQLDARRTPEKRPAVGQSGNKQSNKKARLTEVDEGPTEKPSS